MAKVTITNPTPHKGRVLHGAGGRARRRCRVCGRPVFGRNGGICRDCLSESNWGEAMKRRCCVNCRHVQGKHVGEDFVFVCDALANAVEPEADACGDFALANGNAPMGGQR